MILEQRIPGLPRIRAPQKLIFSFDDDHLTVRLQGRKGIAEETSVHWQDVPARKYFSDAVETDALMQGLLIIILIIALATMFVLRGSPPAIYLTVEMTCLFSVLTVGLHFLFRRRSTKISTSQGVVSVFRTKNHDQIINEILAHRKAFFLKYAAVDSEQSIRQNLKRLRWLTDIDVIERERFAALQYLLLPSVQRRLIEPEEFDEPHTRREQHYHFAKFTFDFYSKYFRVDFRAIGYGRLTTNVDYTRLPAKPIPKRATLLAPRSFTAICLAFIFIVATADCLLDPSGTSDEWWLVLELLLIGLVTLLNFFRISVFQILPGVYVEADHGGDGAILSALEGRRVAALRRLAEPDPLSTVAEHAATLEKLKIAGAITEEEVAHHKETAAASIIPELDQLADIATPEAAWQTLH